MLCALSIGVSDQFSKYVFTYILNIYHPHLHIGNDIGRVRLSLNAAKLII